MPKSVPSPTVGNKPVHTLRHRSLKATVWENQTAKGLMCNVTVMRSYREGEAWHDTHSFGYDDLMNLAKLLYDAHSFITARRAQASKPPRTAAVR